jgi:hypothetical protein
MRTYAEPQQEAIVEQKRMSNIDLMKERNLRILYICFGIVLLVVGLVLFLIR